MKRILIITILTSLLCSVCAVRADDSCVLCNEFLFTSAPFKSCHAATIAEASDGTLVAAWFAGTKEGASDVAIWASRLEKGAEQWTAPELVANADDETTPCWNPVLFQPKNGALYLFYKQGRRISEWQGVAVVSHDCGRSWSERRVLPEFFIGPVKNKPIELSDGSWLFPSSTEHNGWRVHFELIPAFDKTWLRTEAINSNSECGAIQPTLLIHSGCRLQALCRNRDGTGNILQTWSEDFGRTWSKLEPISLPNPCSGIDAVTLEDGRHLLVYNHSRVTSGGRNILNVAISADGVSWRGVLTLENSSGEYSYPAVIQTSDGAVHILYTWRRTRIRHVVLDPEKIDGVPILDGVWPEDLSCPIATE